MKLSEKIVALRRTRGMTQEELAALCHVSRQAVSKWEADIALPETDKLLVLGELFRVSMDTLLKDELTLQEVRDVPHCGQNALQAKRRAMYEGILMKESLSDDSIIECLRVHRVELWHTGGRPRYWTALYFTTDREDFPEQIAKVMLSDPGQGGNWFVDFKAGDEKYVVFRDTVLKYRIGDQAEKEAVREACRKRGIPDEQMQWPE